MSKLSPLMEQYYSIKSRCPDAILLFRMGDFYETFGDDAVVASRVLNIALTSRQRDDSGNKIPLAGVPYHAVDAYLSRLVKAGYKVAICEQMEDPRQAKGIVKRDLVRIITPGTIIEPSMLEEGSNNFLAALFEESGSIGLAFLDVSTGEFLATELKGPDVERKLASELARFRPAECLVPSSRRDELKIVEYINLQPVDDSFFAIEKSGELIREHFASNRKKLLDSSGKEDFDYNFPTDLYERPACISACGAILSYLHKTELDYLDHITGIKFYSISDFMVLDDVTLRNLEIFKNIRDGSRRGTLIGFLSRTKTPMGSRTLRKWLQMPLLNPLEIELRLLAEEELISDSFIRADLTNRLEGLGDVERITARISCDAAGPKDLVALKASLVRLPCICRLLLNTKSELLRKLKDELNPESLSGIVDLIDRAIVNDPPAGLRDGGIIREGYKGELDQLRLAQKEGKGWISGLERSLRNRTGIKSLKVGYTSVFGYYIEVTRPNLSSVPEDFIRKQTLANAERFITPELKEMESRVLMAEERSKALEYEIFTKIRSEIACRAKEILERATVLGILDVILALSNVAMDCDFVKPILNRAGEISIRDSRHPVLEQEMRGSFVSNDVYLNSGDSRFIILTGPNMAGKSTYMRQIALTVILAQMGSYVPASFASIGIVDRIFTRVGAYDDLASGQSTFMMEMTELANILGSATERSLILLDEVGRGTSTFDGLAIAWAVSEYLHSLVKGKVIFATHYHQLTQLGGLLSGLKNYNMAVKEEGDSITFLRTVVPGATDKSYGIHVAKLAGVPEEVIRRAREILKAIEKEAVIEPLSGSKTARRSQKYTQLIFFDTPDKKDPLLEEIKGLDINTITPVEALNMLVEYQKRLLKRGDA